MTFDNFLKFFGASVLAGIVLSIFLVGSFWVGDVLVRRIYR